MPDRRIDRRRDLLVLARAAMTNLQAARDLDWLICWQIRLWEKGLEIRLATRGLEPAYGRFDHHRMQDICYLVKNLLFREIVVNFDDAASVLDPGVANTFCETMRVATRDVCAEEFDKLAAEIDAMDQPVYQPLTELK